MSSLRRNLKQLFALIALIGAGLLVSGLYGQWQGIAERSEMRQRSQIATLASATRNMMASQEMVLDLLGRQLLVDGLVDDSVAAVALLDRMLELNPTVAGYGLVNPAGERLAWTSRSSGIPARERQTILPDTLESMHMRLGRPYLMEHLGEWVVPVCMAIRDTDGRVLGVMTASLRLQGPRPFFEERSFLGETNTVQIVRESDLFPLHWAAAMDPPEGYYTRSIPREYYLDAIASAERHTGADIEEIMASGRPVGYYVTNALGPHFGMAVFDPTFDYWVLTQTHRNQLLAEFARVGSLYVAVFVVLLLAILVVLRMISRTEHQRQRELVHRANHDVLTGLPNRQRMTADFKAMQKAGAGQLSLLFIDMDNFKSVNDGFGHVQGDALLKQLGRRLSAFASDSEKVARIGGDEFVLLTPETDQMSLVARANRLIERLAAPYTVNNVRCELGCSVGIASMPSAGRSLNDMLRAADVAMYAAKSHRNSARLYDPSMGHRYLENIRIEQRLRAALEHELIEMVYQPQVDRDGRIVGVEALARWQDAQLGRVEPRRFIAIAETSGLISRLGDYIVDRCLGGGAVLEKVFGRPIRLAINISARQFLQQEFAERILERFERAEFDNVQLVLEITESLFMEDLSQIMGQLESLRMAGVWISLDDFGTGFSSLSLLRKLPVDELKIDKSFVDNLERDAWARELVHSIISIGRTHGMTLLAEGVETRQQFEILRRGGCDAFQGYYFGRPMDINALKEFVAKAPAADVSVRSGLAGTLADTEYDQNHAQRSQNDQ